MLSTANPGFGQYVGRILPTDTGDGWAFGAGGGQIVGSDFRGAVLWEGPDFEYRYLEAEGFKSWGLLGVGGGQQVGSGYLGGSMNHPLMWSGTSESVVDLYAGGFSSHAYGTDGKSQVGDKGVVLGGNVSHALLWRGTAESVVELHPDGFEWSIAYGVWGDRQVGNAQNTPIMWSGTAESATVLPVPKGSQGGGAGAIHGDQIVGDIGIDGTSVAIIWDADTGEYTTLGGGFAEDTNGRQQVGTSRNRATVWSGTEESKLDLHQFLPGGFLESRATGIDENGTIVGWGVDMNAIRPLVWTPVPEPSSLLALGAALAVVALRKRDV